MKLLNSLTPTRNPLLQFVEGDIKFIGDSHLGRKFKNNITLSRKGEYEAKQYSFLSDQLENHVEPHQLFACQVGDWFDKAQVSNFDILKSVEILQEYELDKDNPLLFIISGNHDDSRSNTEPTAWDILNEFFRFSTKVVFVKTWYVHVLPNKEEVLFVGWNINQNVVDSFNQAVDLGYTNIKMVVCHLDKISYGDDTNVIPYDYLNAQGIQYVVSGHEHKPYAFHEQNMQIIGTGSLLPYSHAEDTTGEHYLTFRSLEELQAHNLDDLKDKHVRIYVDAEELEQLPEFDCISFQVNKTKIEDQVFEEVIIEAYNAKSIWEAAATEVGLDSDQSDDLWLEISSKGVEE